MILTRSRHGANSKPLRLTNDSISAGWCYDLSRPVKNEAGMVLVIAVMMLAILTFLGIASLNTTSTEVRISGNDKVYKQAFYNADAGISYAVQQGVAFFPTAPAGVLTPLATPPVDLSSDITLQYIDMGGSPRRVEVWSTGAAPGGGNSVVIAGMVGIPIGVPPNWTGYRR